MIGKLLRGFVDGSLSTLGIVIGASTASSSIIIAAALGGAVANGISNTVSALSAAQAEEYMDLRQLEKAMVVKDLKNSALERRIGKMTAIAGIIDGLATIIGGAIPILPYLFTPPLEAMFISIGLVIAVTFIIGLYLGRVSKRNILFSALKMAVFTIIVAVAVYLIQSVIVPSQGS